MPTNNSWNSQNPAQVAMGGTGLASTTAYGLITGGTTSTGNFQTVTPGAAHTLVTSGGTGALHTYTSAMKVTSDVMTNTAQPVFSAYKSSSSSNQTGDGTAVNPVIFDTSLVNQATSYATGTGIFTAPTTGTYLFIGGVAFFNMISTHTAQLIQLVTTSNNVDLLNINYISTNNVASAVYCGSAIVPMTANDTAKIQAIVSNGTKTVGINGQSSAAAAITFFMGFLLC